METAQRDANTKSSEGVGVGGFSVVSIQVYSVELWIVPRTWPKERRIFHPKCFSCSRANYIGSERNFGAISLLEFVSKRLVSKPDRFPQGVRASSLFSPALASSLLFSRSLTLPSSPLSISLWFLVSEFIIAQLFISQFSLWFPCHRISWWEVLRCGTDTECSKTKYFEIDPSFTAAPIAKSCSFSNGFWAEKAGIKDQSPGPW